MTSETRTYTPYVPDALIKAVGFEAAVLACKLPLFADESGRINVSLSFLAELWGVNKRTLKAAADKLNTFQVWHYKTGVGRGNYTEWKKGTNFASFVQLEKVQILHKKGTNFAPLLHNNKDTINNGRAGARESFKRKINIGDTPKTPRKGTRLTRDQYYALFGDDAVRAGWRFYKPDGYERFIYEKQ